MQFRLRTLLIISALGPPILAGGYSIRGTRFFGEFLIFLPLLAGFACLAAYTWSSMLAAEGYRNDDPKPKRIKKASR